MGEVSQEIEENIVDSELRAYKNIHQLHGYKLLQLEENYAKVALNSNKSETVDETNILYDSSVFSAANFCAMASINEPEVFLINANIDFFNQINTEDGEVIFEAKATSNISGKKHIQVRGKINDITVFLGEFVAMKLDNNSLIKSIKSNESVSQNKE